MIQRLKKIGQGCLIALGVLFIIVFVILFIQVSNERRTATVAPIPTVPTYTATAPAKASLPTVTPEPPIVTPTSIPLLTRCLDVPEEMIHAIESGLTVNGGGRLNPLTAQAVRSHDFNKVFFIAAAILGAGMGSKGTIGVWATNDLEPGKGLIYAVDGIAVEFSDWGDGRKTDAQMSIVSDGARDAITCVREKQ